MTDKDAKTGDSKEQEQAADAAASDVEDDAGDDEGKSDSDAASAAAAAAGMVPCILYLDSLNDELKYHQSKTAHLRRCARSPSPGPSLSPALRCPRGPDVSLSLQVPVL